jgi:hypothetical protein
MNEAAVSLKNKSKQPDMRRLAEKAETPVKIAPQRSVTLLREATQLSAAVAVRHVAGIGTSAGGRLSYERR